MSFGRCEEKKSFSQIKKKPFDFVVKIYQLKRCRIHETSLSLFLLFSEISEKRKNKLSSNPTRYLICRQNMLTLPSPVAVLTSLSLLGNF